MRDSQAPFSQPVEGDSKSTPDFGLDERLIGKTLANLFRGPAQGFLDRQVGLLLETPVSLRLTIGLF